MKNNNIIVLLGFSIFLMSCKKDKLEGDKNSLTGKWKWVYTQYTHGWCDYDSFYETLTPQTTQKTFKVDFLEKGKMRYYENDEFIDKYRLVFNYFELASDGGYYFYFYLNNDTLRSVSGSIHADTLHLSRFPFMEENPNCENYLNFFVRE